MADVILVNSNFTSKIFRNTFTSLNSKELRVLYPSLNTEKFDSLLNNHISRKPKEKLTYLQEDNLNELAKVNDKKKYIFLSINRYERKKDLKLALNALAHLRNTLSAEKWSMCHLVMAGGFDHRVSENVNHYSELKDMADSLKLT